MPMLPTAKADDNPWLRTVGKAWLLVMIGLMLAGMLFMLIGMFVYRDGGFVIYTNSVWSALPGMPWYRAGMLVTAELSIDMVEYPAGYAVQFVPTLLLVDKLTPDDFDSGPRPLRMLVTAAVVLLPLAAEILILLWLHHMI